MAFNIIKLNSVINIYIKLNNKDLEREKTMGTDINVILRPEHGHIVINVIVYY